MSNTNLNWFIFFWISFTCLNVYVYHVKPNEVQKAAIQEQQKKNEPIRQNEPMYIDLLGKLKNENCQASTDPENNTFYSCKDGVKVSMIKWTRGERKGVVTRAYDPQGNLVMIY